MSDDSACSYKGLHPPLHLRVSEQDSDKKSKDHGTLCPHLHLHEIPGNFAQRRRALRHRRWCLRPRRLPPTAREVRRIVAAPLRFLSPLPRLLAPRRRAESLPLADAGVGLEPLAAVRAGTLARRGQRQRATGHGPQHAHLSTWLAKPAERRPRPAHPRAGGGLRTRRYLDWISPALKAAVLEWQGVHRQRLVSMGPDVQGWRRLRERGVWAGIVRARSRLRQPGERRRRDRRRLRRRHLHSV